MVFAENQEQNQSYTFKDMLLQPDKSDFIIAIVKEVEVHEVINHWKLMKKSKVNNKHKNKDGKLKTILSLWYFKRKIFPYEILMKHKTRLCGNEVIQKWGFNYWETHVPVVDWISVRSLLVIKSIHKFPNI